MKPNQLDHKAHKASPEKHPMCYLVHDMDTPMNIGSLFRIADALGVGKIYLTGRSLVPPNSKIRKTSRATENYVPYEYHQDPVAVVHQLKDAGYRIISLEITSTSIDIKNYQPGHREKICLIPGSENTGVCQVLLDVSDVSVHIPMLGNNSSMNVANACAIATYELTRHHREK